MKYKAAKITIAAIIGVGCVITASMSLAQNAPFNTHTWSNFIAHSSDYDPNANLWYYVDMVADATLISTITPPSGIAVTRIEARSQFGPIAGLPNVCCPQPYVVGPCSVSPGLEITDGTTSYTLTLPNAAIYPDTGFNGFVPPVGGVTNNSGPISVEFPPGATIQLRWVYGWGPDFAPCLANNINVTVQYAVTH